MFFRKACQYKLFFNFFTCRNSLPKFSSFKIQAKIKKNFSASRILITSAAVGLSVYVVSKQVTVSETLDINTNLESKSAVNNYHEAISKSRDIIHRLKDEFGIPGIVAGVSINGETVWTEGFGYADVENRVLCSADTVMRIASISKSITMAAVAKLWEQGKLDLDKPVQDYVPYFPLKTFDGKPVTITCRQLVSHLGGIRSYDKSVNSTSKNEGIESKEKKDEFDHAEYYITEHYKDVKSALDIFKDDPLVASPGSKCIYSTHGWTLISAIVEVASKEDFPTHMKKLFKSLGMDQTYLDINDSLIYYRSRNYKKAENRKLLNVPYVDNSYKWAGGGFLSTVGDLLQFGNAMLCSLQCSLGTLNKDKLKLVHKKNISSIDEKDLAPPVNFNCVLNKRLAGFLSPTTVKAMWSPVTDYSQSIKYGMGWFVWPEANACMFCERKTFCVYHTGGAIGASSILLILPNLEDSKINNFSENHVPNGIIITILTNLQSVTGLAKTALNIGQLFANSEHSGNCC